MQVDRDGEEVRFLGKVESVRWDKTRDCPPFDDFYSIM